MSPRIVGNTNHNSAYYELSKYDECVTESNTQANQDFIDALVQTSFEVIAVVSRVGAEHDLSLTLMRMLGILRDRVLSPAELADYLGLERSTVSGLIDRAERRGLISREASQTDGRSTRLTLSPEGHSLAETATGKVATRLSPLVEDIEARYRDSQRNQRIPTNAPNTM